MTTQENVQKEVIISSNSLELRGLLGVPAEARSIVLFAHGSGSGRKSPRNQFVADVLQKSGHATLLLDLLDETESEDRSKVFDIDLLAERLILATDWLGHEEDLRDLSIGYFGASTGAGAALQAAARLRDRIFAVVSRGGRPDLAEDWLKLVEAPTLLIVGARDESVIELNEHALHQLQSFKELVIVPKATHLFEEPGTLESVAHLATDWFDRHLENYVPKKSVHARSLQDTRI